MPDFHHCGECFCALSDSTVRRAYYNTSRFVSYFYTDIILSINRENGILTGGIKHLYSTLTPPLSIWLPRTSINH
jgi:hypothetical protein